jgi:hypothetical protein
MEFDPPLSERKTKELFDIISNDIKWTKEIQLLAEEELYRRNLSQKVIAEEKDRRVNILKKINERRSKIFEKNRTESYTAIEMVLILVFSPFSLFIDLNPLTEFWRLEAGNFKRKIWQRVFLIVGSIVLWIQIVRLIL